MWQWIFNNINGKHQQKKAELKNDDEYFDFMIKDFNRRLQFSYTIGFLTGAIMLTSLFLLMQ